MVHGLTNLKFTHCYFLTQKRDNLAGCCESGDETSSRGDSTFRGVDNVTRYAYMLNSTFRGVDNVTRYAYMLNLTLKTLN